MTKRLFALLLCLVMCLSLLPTSAFAGAEIPEEEVFEILAEDPAPVEDPVEEPAEEPVGDGALDVPPVGLPPCSAGCRGHQPLHARLETRQHRSSDSRIAHRGRTRRGDPGGRPAGQGIDLSIKRGEFAEICGFASLFSCNIVDRRREGARPFPASASGVQVVLFHYAARPSKERKR